MTAAVSDVDAAFEAALSADAGLGAPADVPAPPRHEREPAAPHGRNPDGSPLAPYGLKADGTPRLREPGPGRPKADDKPRVTASAPVSGQSPAKDGGDADYAEDLMGLGLSVWIAASSLKGGKLLGFPVPDCRPYAMAWRAQLPQSVAAWNAAAKQNATVRGYVEKFTGDGSMTWIIGVAVASAGFVAAVSEIAKAGPEVREQLAAANDKQVQVFITQQVKAAGLQEAAA
jgi:hypothetical protein